MNSVEISNVIRSDPMASKTFRGVFACDELRGINCREIKRNRTSQSFIVNLDSSEKSGSHWVALYFDSNGQCDYFDSFGIYPIGSDIPRFISLSSTTFRYNTKTLQELSSSYCGFYSCFFILTRSRGISMPDIVNIFSIDLEANDEFVYNYVTDSFS